MLDFLLFISITLNLIFMVKNQTLKSQLRRLNDQDNKYDTKSEENDIPSRLTIQEQTPSSDAQISAQNTRQLTDLEVELDDEIQLDSSAVQNLAVQNIDKPDDDISQARQQEHHSQQENGLQIVLQKLSGWPKAFIPFLIQNIGWFIGVLCFISGSVFLVSYSQGFSKSVTIVYTILTYTIVLAWVGYYLKKRISQANLSAMVLLGISFLLIPLNFTAAARLISISIEYGLSSSQLIIAVISTLIVTALLFYTSKLVSGIFNRQLLRSFNPVFFIISAMQLFVPLIYQSQSTLIFFSCFSIVFIMLLLAFCRYLPTVLKHLFVDKKYLILFSVGSLTFTALVSLIHLHISYSETLALSYYAPFVLMLSAVLFYMDDQLHNYKQNGGLLSLLTIMAYVLSFAALFLSFDIASLRLVTMTVALLLYLRLMWLYYSLVPLYLIMALLAFIYCDVFLLDETFNLSHSLSVLYISLFPLIILFGALYSVLRKHELKRQKSFQLTRHLLHTIFIVSIVTGIFSQFQIQTDSIAWLNTSVLMLSLYYLIRSNTIRAFDIFSVSVHSVYSYLFAMLPMVLILVNQLINSDLKLLILTLFALLYSLNSYFSFIRLFPRESEYYRLERSLFINSSLMISGLILLLAGIGFELSLKISLLFFVLSLNSLFLSISLYNRALFYVFMLLLSCSAVIIRYYFKDSVSTGFLLSCFVFVLFYLVYFLQKRRIKLNQEGVSEEKHAELIHLNVPEKLLWFYPVNDLTITGSSANNDSENLTEIYVKENDHA